MFKKVFLILSAISLVILIAQSWFLFDAHWTPYVDVAIPHTAGNLSVSPSNYKMVVAIRTAKRTHPTVIGVATRLAGELNHLDYKLLVWQSYSAVDDVETRRALTDLGATVFTQRAIYPELADDSRIKITWGDPLAQVKWRTNHGLDFANLLERSLEYKTDFILMLEDDMLPAKNSLDKVYLSLHYGIPVRVDMLGYVAFFSFNRHTSARGMVDITKNLGAEGACALGFHRSFVPRIIERLRSRPYDNPVDMALWGFIREEQQLHVFERLPNLFQHIPKESTLIRPVQRKKKMEERSTTFVYDEDNITALLYPTGDDGYIGCFHDMEIFSDLSGSWKHIKSDSDILSNCRAFCMERLYLFMGIGSLISNKETVLCSCGNGFGVYGAAEDNDCSFLTESNQKRGRYLKNAVYRVQSFNAAYLGCHRDDPARRDLEKYVGMSHQPITCMAACSKYKYFGLQYGGECYCGDSYGAYGRSREEECFTPCSSDSKLICGGVLRNSVFKHGTQY